MLRSIISTCIETPGRLKVIYYLPLLFTTLIIAASCKKEQAKLESENITDQAFTSALLQHLKSRMESSEDGNRYLSIVRAGHGTILWKDAKLVKDESSIAHIIPVLDNKAGYIVALLVIEGTDTIRAKLLKEDGQDLEGQSVIAKTNRLIQYFNFALQKKQPLRQPGIKFRIPVTSDPNGKVSVNRAVPYVISICYDFVVCTGDGNGNCIGNYTYYSECNSNILWVQDFDFVQSGGGYSDPDLGTRPGRGGSGNSNSAASTYLLPPTSPVIDLYLYTGCFDRSQAGKLTIYVDQPQPGSDEPFTILGKMGHVFISLEQKVGRTIIRRFFGFHPSGKVNPFGNRVSPSTIGNDQSKKYDIYLPIELNAMQFDAALGAIHNYKASYDLENYNCTDFALDISTAAGHSLPRNSGWWIFGSGRNPGRFGEDLRRIQGNVSQSGKAPANLGNCIQ